jgi:hypothetical protein
LTVAQRVAPLQWDAERPAVRYDAERRNEEVWAGRTDVRTRGTLCSWLL